jgi:hypothetical protein
VNGKPEIGDSQRVKTGSVEIPETGSGAPWAASARQVSIFRAYRRWFPALISEGPKCTA